MQQDEYAFKTAVAILIIIASIVTGYVYERYIAPKRARIGFYSDQTRLLIDIANCVSVYELDEIKNRAKKLRREFKHVIKHETFIEKITELNHAISDKYNELTQHIYSVG